MQFRMLGYLRLDKQRGLRRIDTRGKPVEDFTLPAGMVARTVCTESGMLATDQCPGTASEMYEQGSEPTEYKGSSGIVGVLQYMCAAADIPTVSLWASVPHYVAQSPSPKVTLALLRSVEDVLDVSLPQADLPEEARAWERGVDELAQQDSDVAEYVRTLEEAKDATDLPEASGDAIAREFERYLRRRGDNSDGDF